MAKFAVLFFAALAFQAAFAGVFDRQPWNQPLSYQDRQIGEYEYGLEGYAGQIHAVANQWSLALQNVHPTSKTLVWQSRELAQVVEEIIDRLQAENGNHSYEIENVLQQVVSQLRELQVSLHRVAGYTDISEVSQLKEQLANYVQILAKIVEKLMYLVKVNPIESQGSLHVTIKMAVSEFMTAFRHIQTQVPYVSHAAEYEHSPMQWAYYGLKGDDLLQEGLYNPVAYKAGKYGLGYQYGIFGQSGFKYGQGTGLAMQMHSVASDLSAALRYVYADNTIVRQSLITLVREYVQNLELIVERLEQVSYTTGATTITSQQVAQELRRYVLSLEQLVSSGISMNAVELRNQLCLYVQQIASELEKLTYGVQPGMQLLETRGSTYTVVKGVLVQFLTATRNLQIQVQNIAQVGQRGQTLSGFGMHIQTLANGLTSALESVSVDNVYVRQVLAQQSREFAQYLEAIVERLQTVSYNSVYGADLPRQVAANLRQIVVALQQFANVEDVAFAYKLKMHLIAYIHEAATEIQKLMWVGQNYQQQGQGEFVNTALYGIFNDFVAALQRFQMQFHGMYQTGQYSQYGFGSQHLALQIQAITNNMAIYFHNVPTSDVRIKQQIEIQSRKLAHNIESIIERLELEAIHTTEGVVMQKVVAHLRQIVVSLEQLTVCEASVSSHELFTRFYVVLQKVAADMKKMVYLAQYNMQEVHGNVNSVIRSVLVQYLVVLQHAHVQFQGYGQTVLVGQTPRELALQIQVVAHRLTGMLHVVPDNKQTQIYLIYQARRLSYIIDVIAHKMQAEMTTGTGNMYHVVHQVAANLKQIQMSLQQAITSVEVVSTHQLKMQLAACIQDAAIEIQKLMFVGQYDMQQFQGSAFAFVKIALVDFLSGLQHMQLQIQSNLQIVYNGQAPRTLVMQIQSIASRLSAYLQYAQSNSQQVRQIFIIQIGEFAQTIENVIHMLNAEIKNNGENNVIFKQVVEQLTKISLALQRVTDVESKIPVPELSAQFALNIQRFISEIERLAYISQYKVEQTFVGTYHNGVVNGVFNNVLATFRNIFIQFQNFRQLGQYGHTTQELTNQIQTVTNHLAQSFQLVGASNKQVKQALAIQSLKFARRVQYIVERLESEVSYNSEININALQQIVQNLKQVVSTLQQIGGIWTTATVADLRTQINSQVQSATAQFQKLLVAQTTLQQTHGYVSSIVKSVLIEYLAMIQNLHIRVQSIAQVSQKSQNLYQLAIQIETAAYELSTSFKHVRPTNKLVGQIIPVEAHQLAKVVAIIVNKLHSITGVEINGIVYQVAAQLKQIQFTLQQIAEVQTIENVYQQKMHLEVCVRRAAILIQQLVWAIQPEIQHVEITGFETIVRDILFEFWGAIQNVHVQIQNVVQNGQTHASVWGLDLLGQGKYQGQYYGSWDMQGDYQGQYYRGLGLEREGDFEGKYYRGLGLEREGDFEGKYYRGLGLEREGDFEGKYYRGLGLEREGDFEGKYYRGLGLEREGDFEGKYYRGLGLEREGDFEGKYYRGLGLEREGDFEGKYYRGLGLEREGDFEGKYYRGLGLEREGDFEGKYYRGLGLEREGDFEGKYYRGLGLEREGDFEGKYYRGLGLEREGDFEGKYYRGLGLEREGDFEGKYYRGLGLEREGDFEGKYYRGLGLERQGEFEGKYYGGVYRPYAALQGLLSRYSGVNQYDNEYQYAGLNQYGSEYKYDQYAPKIYQHSILAY